MYAPNMGYFECESLRACGFCRTEDVTQDARGLSNAGQEAITPSRFTAPRVLAGTGLGDDLFNRRMPGHGDDAGIRARALGGRKLNE